MKSLAVKHNNISVRRGGHAAVIRNTRLNLQACTLWSLQRKSSKDQIDLTGPIGNHRIASIASKDFITEEPIDYTLLDHGGLHLVFEAHAERGPATGSPCSLFVVNASDTKQCQVCLDGAPLQKETPTQVQPGCILSITSHNPDKVEDYIVLRNVFAHA